MTIKINAKKVNGLITNVIVDDLEFRYINY